MAGYDKVWAAAEMSPAIIGSDSPRTHSERDIRLVRYGTTSLLAVRAYSRSVRAASATPPRPAARVRQIRTERRGLIGSNVATWATPWVAMARARAAKGEHAATA